MIRQIVVASAVSTKLEIDDNTVSVVDKIVNLFMNAPTINLIIFAIVVFFVVIAIKSIINKGMKTSEDLTSSISNFSLMIENLNKTLNNMQIILFTNKTSSDERNGNYQRAIEDVQQSLLEIQKTNATILKEFAVFNATRCKNVVREVERHDT